MFTDDYITPLAMAQQIANSVSTLKNVSLPEYTKSTRLSPIVLIDKNVLIIEPKQITALLQTVLSIYSAHYLMAVNISMNVGNVKVMRLLDQFSTDRSILNAASNSMWLSAEAIDSNSTQFPSINQSISMEFIGSSQMEPLGGGTKTIDNDKTLHTITDDSNLSVGKLLDVKVSQGEYTTTIPVLITLNTKLIEGDDFVAICNANSIDKSMSGRWHQWRSGEISAIKDYLLCLDIIEADKKALLADKTHSLLGSRSKRYKGVIATLLSGYASPNAVSTMVIISKETANKVELTIRGSLKNHHVRDKYFESNSTMMLVILDTKMERFTIYQRGIADYREYTLEDIKHNDKKPNGVDIDSVLKAYQLGNVANI